MTAIGRILHSAETGIVYEPKPGKPNKDKRLFGPDSRPRIGQKGHTLGACQFYVLNYLRERVGKEHAPEYTSMRAVEKTCSLRRKAITQVEDPMVKILDDITGKRKLETYPPEQIAGVMALFEEWKNTETKTVADVVKLMEQRKIAKRIEINIKFLQEMQIDVQDLFEREYTIRNGYPFAVPWSIMNTLEARNKIVVLDAMAFKVMAEKFGLEKAIWTPHCAIDKLIHELKEYGPIAINAIVGRAAYVHEPFKMERKIGDRSLYAWKPGAERKPLPNLSGHIVLVVGAEKIQDKEYVYFIDPVDPSSPANVELQKIYVVSYENFKNGSLDLHGRSFSQHTAKIQNQIAPSSSELEYGYRRSSRI